MILRPTDGCSNDHVAIVRRDRLSLALESDLADVARALGYVLIVQSFDVEPSHTLLPWMLELSGTTHAELGELLRKQKLGE